MRTEEKRRGAQRSGERHEKGVSGRFGARVERAR